jgi:hypothetical protein
MRTRIRQRLYGFAIAAAVLVVAVAAGGYFYLIWIQRIVEQVTD